MDYKFINTEYLDSVSAGDPEIIVELVSLFKEQVIEISEEMQSLLAAKTTGCLDYSPIKPNLLSQ
ncbi:MAG: hypothetical protein IPJ37_21905 [Bacteroidales bacterium]|nr:hypothetical protein [Bacteroidales bacterium]